MIIKTHVCLGTIKKLILLNKKKKKLHQKHAAMNNKLRALHISWLRNKITRQYNVMRRDR